MYATLTVTNIMNQSLTETFQIKIDSSVPKIENVVFVTWTNPYRERIQQICQQPWTYVDVKIAVLEDEESGIFRYVPSIQSFFYCRFLIKRKELISSLNREKNPRGL